MNQGTTPKSGWLAPVILATLLLAVIALHTLRSTPTKTGSFEVNQFGRLAAVHGGRIIPFDSIARNELLMLSGRSSFYQDNKKHNASQWLLDMLLKPHKADDYKVFRIDHPGVIQTLGLPDDGKRFSYRQIHPHWAHFRLALLEIRRLVEQRVPPQDFSEEQINVATEWDKLQRDQAAFAEQFPKLVDLQDQVQRAIATPEQKRDLFQSKILALSEKIMQYERLIRSGASAGSFGMVVVPPAVSDQPWMSFDEASRLQAAGTGKAEPLIRDYQKLIAAYQGNQGPAFNLAVKSAQEHLAAAVPSVASRAGLESSLNRAAPFYQSLLLYVAGAIAVILSWLGKRRMLLRTAVCVLAAALVIHTVGLILRIYISERPPVTTLYSSALFIGWGCAVTGLIMERIYRNGFGLLTAAIIGALTLTVAQGLALDGDTLPVMQAVLDTNFWLATHVVIITLGYSATFLAGIFGIILIMKGVMMSAMDRDQLKSLGQMIYGTVCFAVLFSFVGTILGGIWADQSWGRFWGWDPKENGAVLIVLWSAMTLHARWGGMVQQRGLAMLAVAGTIVTVWSWFGTNMLGAGLHAYGFIEAAVFWIFAFVLVQLLLVNYGARPPSVWASYPLKSNTPGPMALSVRLCLHSLLSTLLTALTIYCLFVALPEGSLRWVITMVLGTALVACSVYIEVSSWSRAASLYDPSGTTAAKSPA